VGFMSYYCNAMFFGSGERENCRRLEKFLFVKIELLKLIAYSRIAEKKIPSTRQFYTFLRNSGCLPNSICGGLESTVAQSG
jgi:hypothetical protein